MAKESADWLLRMSYSENGRLSSPSGIISLSGGDYARRRLNSIAVQVRSMEQTL